MKDIKDDDFEVIRPVFGSQTTMEHKTAYCTHTQMLIDEIKRTLSCKSCGAVLDPFEVHLQYARRERNWRHWQGEISAFSKKLDELKAEEKRVKARTKAAARKDAETAVAEERSRSYERRYEMSRQAQEIRRLAERIEALTRIESVEEREEISEAIRKTKGFG